MSDYTEIVAAQREFVKSGAPAELAVRRKVLQQLRELLVNGEDRLTAAVQKDLRRDPRTTFVMEIAGALAEIDYCLDHLEEWAKPEVVQRTLATALDTPMIYKDPYGVILLIAPFNYPLSMVLLPIATMLAAGNTVVVKPSEISHHTAQVIDDLFSETFDPRHVAVIQAGVEGTTALLQQRFDFILYTGNQAVGRIVMEAAAKHTTPLVLELGGKCPAVVMGDADLKISARRLAWGKWTNNGQTCISPDYILTTRQVRDRLVDELRNALTEFYGPDPQSSPDYSRIINQRHFDRLCGMVFRSKGTLLHCAGEADRSDLFVPPQIFEVDAEDELMHDEIFGPLLPIVLVDDLDHALEFVNAREKPLAAYLFTRDERKVQRFLTETRSGAVTINDVLLHITVDTLPFGGVGASGFGHYRRRFGVEQFTHKKAVLKRGFFGEGLAACRYPPMSDQKLRQLKQLGTSRAVPPWLTAGVWPFLLGVLFTSLLVWITNLLIH